jgi:predicted AlkP superfamily pyrophosphatase or phosphodiesterase
VGGKEGGPTVTKAEHPSGAHGYLNTDPELQAIFIAAGYGIRPDVVLDEIKNLSVAPTLARLLGVQLPRAEAPACHEILQVKTR